MWRIEIQQYEKLVTAGETQTEDYARALQSMLEQCAVKSGLLEVGYYDCILFHDGVEQDAWIDIA